MWLLQKRLAMLLVGDVLGFRAFKCVGTKRAPSHGKPFLRNGPHWSISSCNLLVSEVRDALTDAPPRKSLHLTSRNTMPCNQPKHKLSIRAQGSGWGLYGLLGSWGPENPESLES